MPGAELELRAHHRTIGLDQLETHVGVVSDHPKPFKWCGLAIVKSFMIHSFPPRGLMESNHNLTKDKNKEI